MRPRKTQQIPTRMAVAGEPKLLPDRRESEGVEHRRPRHRYADERRGVVEEGVPDADLADQPGRLPDEQSPTASGSRCRIRHPSLPGEIGRPDRLVRRRTIVAPRSTSTQAQKGKAALRSASRIAVANRSWPTCRKTGQDGPHSRERPDNQADLRTWPRCDSTTFGGQLVAKRPRSRQSNAVLNVGCGPVMCRRRSACPAGPAACGRCRRNGPVRRSATSAA